MNGLGLTTRRQGRDHRQSREEDSANNQPDTNQPAGTQFAREQNQVNGEDVETTKAERGIVDARRPDEQLFGIPQRKRSEAKDGVAADRAEIEPPNTVRVPATDERHASPAEINPAAECTVEGGDSGRR